jgi:hypothetical protein
VKQELQAISNVLTDHLQNREGLRFFFLAALVVRREVAVYLPPGSDRLY